MANATSVRVAADVKVALDTLQGRVQAQGGARLSHSELLGRMLAYIRRHEGEFMEDEGGIPWQAPGRAVVDRLLGSGIDLGFDTDVTAELDLDLADAVFPPRPDVDS